MKNTRIWIAAALFVIFLIATLLTPSGTIPEWLDFVLGFGTGIFAGIVIVDVGKIRRKKS